MRASKAKARLSELAQELSSLHEEKDTLGGALSELKKRAADAVRVTERADASERCKRVRAICQEIESLGPDLDRTIEHPTDGGLYCPNDPPLQSKVGTLVGVLFAELRALGLDHGVAWPAWRWDLASKVDLAKELRTRVIAGWRVLAGKVQPGSSRSVAFGERRYLSVDFTKLLSVWSDALRADLARHEQERAAA
jgi:hypothetical protein